MTDNSSLVQQFIDQYKDLSEPEQFKLGNLFRQQTGGTLSPYNSPQPVCVALVPVMDDSGSLGFLGIRRAIEPFIGGVALPGGFLNTNEDPVKGAIREVQEETSLLLNEDDFIKQATAVMGTGNKLLLFYRTTQILSAKDVNDINARLSSCDGEVSELVVIKPTAKLCFPLHQDAVNQAFADISPTHDRGRSFKM